MNAELKAKLLSALRYGFNAIAHTYTEAVSQKNRIEAEEYLRRCKKIESAIAKLEALETTE